ncbi:MAG TPA: S8 family serine peptidase [Bryobacteraceae bacterium]|nr:S8 family serine peptidase [Bryobacteraceae bacterium]
MPQVRPLGVAALASVILLPLASQQSAWRLMPPDEFLRRVSQLPLPPDATRGLEMMYPEKVGADLRALLGSGTANTRSVPVLIETARPGDAAEVESAIRTSGGEVVSVFEGSIWARVPAESVTPLAKLPAVKSLSAQPIDAVPPDLPGEANQRNMAPPGDGVRALHLDRYHRQGHFGEGIKVGILDLGFAGYSALVRSGKVNAARAQHAFPLAHRVENQEPHGTACAEVITAGAPKAQLYLASFDGSQGELMEAARWLMDQGVDIINYSSGNVFDPNDGSDALSHFIDQSSRERGVLWIVAAGNHAEQHWAGVVGPGSDVIRPRPGYNGWAVTARGDTLQIVVRWSEAGAATRSASTPQDLDAYLYEVSDRGQLVEVDRSVAFQNGPSARPVEVIRRSKDVAGHQFLLALRAKRLARRVKVHIFLDPGGAAGLYPASREGSILNPASARTAVAVGAVDVMTKALARYSSQGPTDDGRAKPEVNGPTNTISFTYASRNGRFTGTSAASPHVAALAALLKGMDAKVSSTALRQKVIDSVAPDSAKSEGSLESLPREEPAIAIPPEFGGTVTIPLLGALREVADRHTGWSVRMAPSHGTYRVGDHMDLTGQSSEDCSCILIVRDTLGQYEMAPQYGVMSLKKGISFHQTYRVTGSPGTDELLLICARRPAPIQSLINTRSLSVAHTSYQIR